jgi:6-phosphogluconolactonase (cycloisomerase 2 family)
MSRSISVVFLALTATFASAVLASAQVKSSPTDTSNPIEASSSPASSSPAAYVYVSSSPSSGKTQINAYSAASSGSLTAVSGSPFSTSGVSYIALNGKWLFGTNGVDIDSFSIASNGALKQVDSYTAEPNGGVVNLFLDHTGTSLYADYYTTNNDYLQYSINNTTGQLTYVGDLSGGPSIGSVTSFIGDNAFAYSSSCYHFTPSIYGVQRSSNGTLTWLNTNPPYPTPPSGDFYCPYLAAADPTNHLAVAIQPFNGNWVSQGPYQLATYTADSSGNLTTSSTSSNMPSVSVNGITNYWMSPSGKYLAVAGTSGMQIFHFNGANPITKYTGLLVTKQVDQMFWDNQNHLYALSRSAGKLYVFTVTSTSVTQASGSPHSITNPEYLIVLPR